MKKYFFVVVFSLFFLTGCTADYALEVTENSVKERLDLVVDKTKLDNRLFQELTSDKNLVYLDKNKYYNVTYNDNGSFLNIHYNYDHNIDDFNNSRIANWCYSDVQMTKTNDKIIISTDKLFNCAHERSNNRITSTNINIKTELNVISHNADKVNGNIYTWNITEKNYLDKPVHIEIDTSKESIAFTLQLAIGAIIIVIIGFLIYLFIKYKNHKNNKF